MYMYIYIYPEHRFSDYNQNWGKIKKIKRKINAKILIFLKNKSSEKTQEKKVQNQKKIKRKIKKNQKETSKHKRKKQKTTKKNYNHKRRKQAKNIRF